MHTVQFLKKYRQILNISTLELFARVPRNTIAHAIGKEARHMPLAFEDAIQKYLDGLQTDLSNATVEYYQKHKKALAVKELPSSNGVDRKRKLSGKRKTK